MTSIPTSFDNIEVAPNVQIRKLRELANDGENSKKVINSIKNSKLSQTVQSLLGKIPREVKGTTILNNREIELTTKGVGMSGVSVMEPFTGLMNAKKVVIGGELDNLPVNRATKVLQKIKGGLSRSLLENPVKKSFNTGSKPFKGKSTIVSPIIQDAQSLAADLHGSKNMLKNKVYQRN